MDRFVYGKAKIGPTGPQGPTGTSGTNGTDGADGSVWYEGAGIPSTSLGVDSDFYLNTLTSDVYIKTSGSWGSPILNIKGEKGDDGTPGEKGDTGDKGDKGDTGAINPEDVNAILGTQVLGG